MASKLKLLLMVRVTALKSYPPPTLLLLLDGLLNPAVTKRSMIVFAFGRWKENHLDRLKRHHLHQLMERKWLVWFSPPGGKGGEC